MNTTKFFPFDLAKHSSLGRTTRRPILAGLALCALSTFPSWAAERIDLGSGEIVFDTKGEIFQVNIDGHELTLSSGLSGEQVDKTGAIGQSWRIKPEILSEENSLHVKGTLYEYTESGSGSTEPEASFDATYKKIDTGTFEICVDAIYRKAATWKAPLFYYFKFPIAECTGGILTVQLDSGEEKTYSISQEIIPFRIGKICRMSLDIDGQTVTIVPAGRSQLQIADARDWGGDYLRISVATERDWEPTHLFSEGENEAFAATVSLQSNPSKARKENR